MSEPEATLAHPLFQRPISRNTAMDSDAWAEMCEPLELLAQLREPPPYYSHTRRLLHSTLLLEYTLSCLRGIGAVREEEAVRRYFVNGMTDEHLVEQHALQLRAGLRTGGAYSLGRRPRRAPLGAQRAQAGLAALAGSTWEAAVGATRETQHHLQREQCAWLRCLFPNPFRAVALEPVWITSTVIELARGIATGKAFDRLPILADALQDADCDHADLLYHCRHGGPHIHRCWAVDEILGDTAEERGA